MISDILLTSSSVIATTCLSDITSYKKGDFIGQKYEVCETIICCKKALEINPLQTLTWNDMGMVFNSITKYKEAIECYDVVLKITPNKTTAWINKDLALLNLGKYTDAIKC